MNRIAIVCCLLSTACVDTGATRTDIALSVAGTEVDAPFIVDTDWQVSLDSADLAFGPLWLCAGTQAGELCDTARAEWLDSVVIDALDPATKSAGMLDGLTGRVHSWMFDLGIVSLLTQQQPVQLDAASALGGNSVRLSGTATRGTDVIAFDVELRVQQEEDTEQGVAVVRSASAAAFDHELTGSGEALTVRFDPRPWLDAVDFDQFCDATGCASDVVFEPDSQAWRAVRNQLVAGKRPAFDFNQ